MNRRYSIGRFLLAAGGLAAASLAAPDSISGKAAIKFKGMYVEGCSCSAPCPCELVGVRMGCEGVGAFQFDRGTFAGKDLSGVKMAYAVVPGEWVKCYVDAPTAAKRAAGIAMAETAFKDWGTMLKSEAAKIAITGKAGKYTVTVNGGSVMKLTTEPAIGLDKKGPIQISNINSVLHPTVMQGKTVLCTFNDDGKSFEVKGTNAYFNPMLNVDGAL